MEEQKKDDRGRPARDLVELARELIHWAMMEDSLNLNEFCYMIEPKISPQRLSDYAHKDEYFSEAFNIAKSYLAVRREKRLNEGTLHAKTYDMNAKVYDYFIRLEKRREIEHEIECKAKAQQANQLPPNHDLIQDLLEGIDKIMHSEDNQKLEESPKQS